MELLDELAAKVRRAYFDTDLFREEFYAVVMERLRELAGAAVNETIEYWLKSLADGCEGQFPEVSVEIPYVERRENVDALTITYCVANEDGTRTELNRATLERVLMRIVEDPAKREDMESRVKVVACELRALATQLETATGEAVSLERPRLD